jgi:glycosyltransferase involved in cell wall biosynthesis
VSVVVPTRNRAPLLRRSLASALAQVGASFEVIVVDDGSRDETAALLARFSDERLRVITLGNSLGAAEARNVGIHESVGEWLAFLDDDDVWSPEKLRRQIEEVWKRPDAVIGFTGAVQIDAEERVIRQRRTPSLDEFPDGLVDTNLIGGPSTVIARRDVVRAERGFDSHLSVLADWDLWLRLYRPGRLFITPDILVGYRLHDANMHVTQLAGLRRELRYLRRKHRHRATPKGGTVGATEFSLWLVSRYRESGQHLQAAREYARLARIQRRPRQRARAAAVLTRCAARPTATAIEPATGTYPWLQRSERDKYQRAPARRIDAVNLP